MSTARPFCRYCRRLSPVGSTVCANCGSEQGLEALTSDQAAPISTKWLNFWTYVHLPLGVVIGVPLALSRARSALDLLGTIIFEIPIIWLATATVFGLHKRKLSAWQLNWLCLLADVIGFSFARVGKVAGTEKTATFVSALLMYSLIWGIPNYIYFKKRRVLFSGPPLIEDGVRGIFKTIWRFFWPSTASLESARKASRQGFYAASIVAAMTLLLVSFSALGYPLFGVNSWSLFDASVFVAIAWGTYRMSRTASALGILAYIVEQAVSVATQAPQSDPVLISQRLITFVLALMFVNGARGTFAFDRYQKATRDSGGRASVSPARWKVYTAVVASFAFGVLALRVPVAYRFGLPPPTSAGRAAHSKISLLS
jgi:hypothetical protein